MPWCPKCKTEYEEHMVECVDCEIPLVPNLKDHVYLKDLMSVKVEDSTELLSYLDYSGIKTVETSEENDNILIRVGEADYEAAMTYLKVYIHEHMEETNEEDYYFDEYMTEAVDVEAKVGDMKSTVNTFAGVGILAVVVGVFNYLDIIKINGFNKLIISSVLVLMGLIFVYIAYHTQRDISKTKKIGENKADEIQVIVSHYFKEHNFEDLFNDDSLKKEDFDEGALYFAVYDIIKNQVKIMFPESEDRIINTACEDIYEQMNAARNK